MWRAWLSLTAVQLRDRKDGRRPDVFDGAAAIAQSLLADQLAHDVDTLSTINDDGQILADSGNTGIVLVTPSSGAVMDDAVTSGLAPG